jgi:hypothetical protein
MGEFMNSLEFLDKAVRHFCGVFPGHLVECNFLSLRVGNGGIYAPYYVTFEMAEDTICSREEFQQRARELGYLDEYFAVQGIDQQKIKNTLISDIAEQGWYDYETQKALRLPPVGAECLTWFDDGKECWQKCKVLALSPYEQDHMAVSLIGRYDRKLIWSQDFKPLDWNRKKYEAIEAASKCFQAHCMHDYSGQPFLDGLAGLYDAGFLRMPEDK